MFVNISFSQARVSIFYRGKHEFSRKNSFSYAKSGKKQQKKETGVDSRGFY